MRDNIADFSNFLYFPFIQFCILYILSLCAFELHLRVGIHFVCLVQTARNLTFLLDNVLLIE